MKLLDIIQDLIPSNSCFEYKIKISRPMDLSRQKAASYYSKLLDGLVTTPHTLKDNYHVFHCYVIQIDRRDKFINFMKNNKIDCNIHYPIPLHMQSCMDFLGYKKGDFPNVEKSVTKLFRCSCFQKL